MQGLVFEMNQNVKEERKMNAEIKEYNFGKFIQSEQWKKREDLYDFPNFLVSSPNWLQDGFDKFSPVCEKIKFYKIIEDLVNIILAVAKESGDETICAGPYFRGKNLYDWKGMEKYDSFNALCELLKNKEYKLLKISEDENIIGLITENNLRYFSSVSFFLKNADMLILPTHNSELIVFSPDLASAKEKIEKTVLGTSWEVIEDL